MDGADVRRAAEASLALLGTATEADWGARVPGLEMTVAEVVAHAGGAALWYALDVWTSPADDAAFDVSIESGARNGALLFSLSVAARVCAVSLDAAPPGTRGFHPLGSPDPSGFAAMACDELLVHTDDAARGLGLPFVPDADLAGRVLARLFPWHAPGEDPWRTLLWANGRTDLPGRPSQQGWRWHCAPLEEWDGLPPALRPASPAHPGEP